MVDIFPNPKSYQKKDGCFVFGDRVNLTIGSDFANDGFAKICTELWNNFTAYKSTLTVVRSKNPAKTALISINVPVVLPTDIFTENEYEINCGTDGIVIRYQADIGLIHGFFTVLQLLSAYHIRENNFTVECCEIMDKPALAFRGVHIAVFIGESFQFLRKTVRMCALSKYTHVCLEFWGSLRLDCHRATGWDDAFTKDQVAALVAEGNAMGVEFIPFFNHFGHASQSRFRAGKHVYLDQAPELEEYFEPGGWTWNIHNPDAIAFIDGVRAELSELMPGKYFHIGCDEVYAADGRIDPLNRQMNDDFICYINDTCEKVFAMGRTPIVWADMFLDGHKFPYPNCSNVCYQCMDCDKNLERFNREALLCDWQYNIDGSKTETVDYLLRYHDPAKMILAPWHKFDNIDGRCQLAKQHGMFGVLDTTWDLLHRQFSSLIYAACVAWEEDSSYEKLRSWETIKGMTMQNMRKVLPCDGNFVEAGYFDHEIDTIVGTTG